MFNYFRKKRYVSQFKQGIMKDRVTFTCDFSKYECSPKLVTHDVRLINKWKKKCDKISLFSPLVPYLLKEYGEGDQGVLVTSAASPSWRGGKVVLDTSVEILYCRESPTTLLKLTPKLKIFETEIYDCDHAWFTYDEIFNEMSYAMPCPHCGKSHTDIRMSDEDEGLEITHECPECGQEGELSKRQEKNIIARLANDLLKKEIPSTSYLTKGCK